jgi:hypothetical protein
MSQNKTKTDRIHDQMPRFFKTRTNPNWKALIEAMGESDQNVTDLIEEVRKQFFVKTANRPYLDRLGANFKVSRPRLVGMDDPTFRTFIPVLAYQPKQVKLILDDLLDIFFFKETTTAFSQTEDFEPIHLLDGWELEYLVDQTKDERIQFNSADFVDISAATAEEVVSAINRQAQYSFAIVFDDRILKKKFIRLFTNTIGSKGSIQMIGGRADIALRFRGFNDDAGSDTTTQWLVTKIGDTVTFKHSGGGNPNINKVQVGDVVIISIPTNEGSFVVTDIDLANDSFTFTNLFGTPGAFNHALMSPDAKVRFMTPEKIVVYTNNSRSVVWEVTPGEIIVEMPATPPVVKRSLIGSAHLNGIVGSVENRSSSTSLDLLDASEWPMGGNFILKEEDEIQTHILTDTEDTVLIKQFNTRFDVNQKYSYTSKAGNTLNGITPDLPDLSDIYEATIASVSRTLDTVTITTSAPHGFYTGENVRIQNVAPDTDNTLNGTFVILSTPTATSFIYHSFGAAAATSGGVARVERIGMSNEGSLVYLTNATVNSGIYGPYMWDPNAAYVISSMTTHLQTEIKAGNNVRTIEIDSVNNIANAEALIVFDFGTEREEGPVRTLYKPTNSTMQIDPSYVFNFNHDIDSSITVIRRRGAHVMSGLGSEYPAYITDPAVARFALEELMRQVKSVGIFIDFLVRYPNQLYSQLDVYRSGSTDLWPINDEDKALQGL